MKLGSALADKGLPVHIYETAEQAREGLGR